MLEYLLACLFGICLLFTTGSLKSYFTNSPWHALQFVPMQSDSYRDQTEASRTSHLRSSVANGASRFTFVFDSHQPGTRSHAMRAHWSERHRARQEKKRRQASRISLPTLAAKRESVSQSDQSESSSASFELSAANWFASPGQTASGCMTPLGIPLQLFTGFNHALSTSRLDPFDAFPIKLTVEHHKLIHHCT